MCFIWYYVSFIVLCVFYCIMCFIWYYVFYIVLCDFMVLCVLYGIMCFIWYYVFSEICRLQADVGPCDNIVRKWHYNSLSQSCEEFSYGGCLGNHNNFQSQEQCMTYCDASRWQPARPTREPDVTTEGSGEIDEKVTGIGKTIVYIHIF